MPRHHFQFVEEYQDLVGFGLDRKTNEHTLTYYLQKFAEDEHMALIREKMSDEDLAALFDLLTRLLRQYLSSAEYHRYFLKEPEEE
ncbi:MAG: cytoplasmic protein [Desulfobacteraceae bacterium]|nr:MAG: cytoplasmic protein [Desulfobacteraceae bacterium]